VTDGETGETLQALGPIVSVSDTVCHLRVMPRAARTHRRMDVWSRFADPEGLFLQLTPEGYQPLRSSTGWPPSDTGDGTAPQMDLTERLLE
jgi:hypothetical protein